MEQRDNCLKLRREGKSFREISKIMNIPLSTVFLWTKNIELSTLQIKKNRQKSLDILQQSRQLAQKIKKEKYQKRNNLNHKIGLSMVDKINNQNINGIIAALYWGEGFKKDRRLGLANTDPQIIRLFLYWLIKIIKVPVEQIRLRVGINVIFKDRTDAITKYWSGQTNIPLSQFQKPFYQNTKIVRVYPNKNNYYGVLRIRANGQNDTFQKILGMVDKLKSDTKEFL